MAIGIVAIGIASAWRARHAVAATGGERGSGDPGGAWQAVSGPLLATLPAAILAASHVLRGRFTAWLVAVGVLGVVCGGVALLAGFAGTGRPLAAWLRAAIGSRATMPVAATAPALLLLVLVAGEAGFIGSVQAGPAPLLRLQRIWGVDALQSFRSAEGGVAIVFGALLAGIGLYHATAAIVHRRRAAVRDGLGWLFVAFVSLYLVAPNGLLGGGYVLPRLGLYVPIAAVLWIGARRAPAAVAGIAGVVAIVVALALLGLRTASYRALDAQLRAYIASATSVEANSTLLALTYSPYGVAIDGPRPPSVRVKPFAHAGGYIAVQKDLVLLNNYETTADYFPVRFRPERDPARHVGNVLRPWDQVVNVLGYPQRTDGTIDYVLVWGTRGDPRSDPAAAATLLQLRMAGYERVDAPASIPAGLYRRSAR